ncbi:hypothetical protein [Planomonospora sp. ID82291]|uniref:hypothetical protein n=1 Tax=Planomonospora sp. ID82291 TaxID=2738136 RepID=UPI0018C36C98|nr:hypothetical protein [Planomonospora sp. ID82291]MBG0818909.1 hypothetical protein [Planomonospora sp. ID82291]
MDFPETEIRARLAAHPAAPPEAPALTHLYGIQLAEGELAWKPDGVGAYYGPAYVIYGRWQTGKVDAELLPAGSFRREAEARMVASRLENAGLFATVAADRHVRQDQHGPFNAWRVTVVADAALLALAEPDEDDAEPGRGYLAECPTCGGDDPPVTTLGDSGETVTDCCHTTVTTLI